MYYKGITHTFYFTHFYNKSFPFDDLRSILRNMLRKMDSEAMNHEQAFNAEIIVNAAFLSKRVYDFHLLINKQADKVYKNKGIIFPVATSSTVLFLSTIESASLAQIARALDHPHQLIAQRVKALLKLALIEGTQDAEDKRRTLYHLTQTGLIQSQLLHEYCKEAADAFNSLSKEVGVDLHDTLNKACTALETTPFSERFPGGKQNATTI